jgi:hypothetical protein
MEVFMKKILFLTLFGFLSGSVGVLFASGSSEQSSAPTQKEYYVSGEISGRTVNVNYTVSDSVAFSYATAWITQEMSGWEGNPITVNDSANGILAGVCRTFMANVPFRVVVKDGVAILTISDFSYRAPRYATSEQEAHNEVRLAIGKWLDNWSTSFRGAFN